MDALPMSLAAAGIGPTMVAPALGKRRRHGAEVRHGSAELRPGGLCTSAGWRPREKVLVGRDLLLARADPSGTRVRISIHSRDSLPWTPRASPSTGGVAGMHATATQEGRYEIKTVMVVAAERPASTRSKQPPPPPLLKMPVRVVDRVTSPSQPASGSAPPLSSNLPVRHE